MSFTFDFTEDKFAQLISNNTSEWYQALVNNLPLYDINTPERVAAFIAQCAHESGNFIFLSENLNYKAESLTKIFSKYFKDIGTAKQYEKQPAKIANKIYADRMGNGNEASGDGFKYRGRGLIQLTGKTNYTWFAASLEITPEEAAEYMGTFEGAAQSACWFWETNKLNQWADKGDIEKMTKIINGGTHGLDDRIARYNRYLAIIA